MGPALPGKPAQCHPRTWVWQLSPAQTLSLSPGDPQEQLPITGLALEAFQWGLSCESPPLKMWPPHGPLNTSLPLCPGSIHCPLLPILQSLASRFSKLFPDASSLKSLWSLSLSSLA